MAQIQDNREMMMKGYYSVTSEGENEYPRTLITKKDAIFMPHGNFGRTIEDNKDETETGFSASFDKRVELSHGTVTSKARSLSAEFLVKIDELVNNAAASYPLTLDPAEISDVLSLPSPESKASVLYQPSPADEEKPDPSKFTTLSMQLTMPIYLTFEDVRYKVPGKSVKSSEVYKHILHGINGSVHPGEILLLMGPSGSGKTSLLNILSGRIKFNSGTITYNDKPYTKSLRQRMGYVMQDDVLFPHLTVKETLTYAALLRLPNSLSRKQKKERAMNVISELCLERCQDTRIGGKFIRGISGGERKRVCIGTEILLNPSLLFLDEPTSGLDSTTALRIVQILQNVAKDGKTVVTTIHQPSSRLFSMFDKLILLAKGNSLYFGKAAEAMLYFSYIGCSPLIAMNPGEFLIDLANGNMNEKSLPSELEHRSLYGSKNLVHEFLVEAYETRRAQVEKAKGVKLMTVGGEYNMQSRAFPMDYGATRSEQFCILFQRGIRERIHEYFSYMRVVQVISTAIIIGLLWWHPNASSPRSLQDQEGLFFFISVFWGFYPLFSAIFMFPQERAMLVKERLVGMFKLSAYFLARNTSDPPLELLLPTVFMVIVYFMVGLKLSFSAFLFTMVTVFLNVMAAQGLGQTISAAFLDVKKANILASIIVMTFMLSGGFFSQEVPSFMLWIRYVSFNYHTYRLLLKIQHGCSATTSESGYTGYALSKKFGLNSQENNVGAMIVMIFGYRILAYVLLRRMKLRNVAYPSS